MIRLMHDYTVIQYEPKNRTCHTKKNRKDKYMEIVKVSLQK